MGASAPTDPPNPMVTELVRMDDHMLWGLILDSLRDTACRTLVTPWLILSLTTKRRRSSEMNIPIPGRTRYNKACVDPASAEARSLWMRWMSLSRMTAAKPLAIPTSSERIRSLLRSCMFLNNVSSLSNILNEKRSSTWTTRNFMRLPRNRRHLRHTGRCCRQAGSPLQTRNRRKFRPPARSRPPLHPPASALYPRDRQS